MEVIAKYAAHGNRDITPSQGSIICEQKKHYEKMLVQNPNTTIGYTLAAIDDELSNV
jgi:hypothetical protein